MDQLGSISIGVDIVSIERISKNIDDVNDRFINRVYTKNEIKYCKNKNNFSHHFAGKFACKEAVCKSLKIPRENGINWKDIEILNKENIPEVKLHGEAEKIAIERKITNIKISLSHEKDYAVAFVVTF